jgi:hypothetical protein
MQRLGVILLKVIKAPFINKMYAEIRDINVHDQLQADLVEHLWRIKGLSTNATAP